MAQMQYWKLPPYVGAFMNLTNLVQLKPEHEKYGRWKFLSPCFAMMDANILDDATSKYTIAEALIREHAYEVAAHFLKSHCMVEEDPLSLILLAECALRTHNYSAAQEYYSVYLSFLSDFPVEHARRLLAITPSGFEIKLELLTFFLEHLDEIRQYCDSMEYCPTPAPKIYVFWNSGFDSAPPVVKACARQLQLYHPQNDIVFLDSTNWRDYVDIPAEAFDRPYAAENTAFFSDLLRVALLSKFGGVWVDSTCLVSGNIIDRFDEITKSGFVFYRLSKYRIGSWFFCSAGDNYAAKLINACLTLYCKKYDRLLDYFLIHSTVEVCCVFDDKFKTMMDEMYMLKHADAHQLYYKLFAKPFDKNFFLSTLPKSLIHKLTYKAKKKKSGPGTLYHYICFPEHDGKQADNILKGLEQEHPSHTNVLHKALSEKETASNTEAPTIKGRYTMKIPEISRISATLKRIHWLYLETVRIIAYNLSPTYRKLKYVEKTCDKILSITKKNSVKQKRLEKELAATQASIRQISAKLDAIMYRKD